MYKINLSRRLSFSLIALNFAFLAGCAGVPKHQSVAATIEATPELSTLNNLITKAGLTSTLNGTGSFTVFAPNNDAFKAVPQKALDELAANPTKLANVLTYHMIASKALSADVKNSSVKTVQGANLALSKAGTFVTVDDALVVTADINATNGVVHIVDRVLMPPAAK